MKNWKTSFEDYKWGDFSANLSVLMGLKIDQGRLIHPYFIVTSDGCVEDTGVYDFLSNTFGDSFFIRENAEYVLMDYKTVIFSITIQTYPEKEESVEALCYLAIVDIENLKFNKILLSKGSQYKDVKKIDVKGDKIYVLDFGDTLNILEYNSLSIETSFCKSFCSATVTVKR